MESESINTSVYPPSQVDSRGSVAIIEEVMASALLLDTFVDDDPYVSKQYRQLASERRSEARVFQKVLTATNEKQSF